LPVGVHQRGSTDAARASLLPLRRGVALFSTVRRSSLELFGHGRMPSRTFAVLTAWPAFGCLRCDPACQDRLTGPVWAPR
jgi:threonine/homoserine efflux transporter RhtA